jgi:HEPN domain-containing protein
MIDSAQVAWPKSEEEFRELVQKVGAELQTEEVPIPFREMEALRRISGALNAALTEPRGQKSPKPGSYKEGDFVLRVMAWYEQLYGDKLLHDFRPGRTVLLLRGDIWTLHLPRFYGRGEIFCSRIEQTYRPPSGRGQFRYNILDCIENLGPGLRNAFSKEELGYIEQIFEIGHKSFEEIELIISFPLVTDAAADLYAAVFHLTARNRHHGLSKWSSLQAVEKMVKAYLKQKTGRFDRGHVLEPLVQEAENAGLKHCDRRLVKTVQCSPDARYGDEPVSLKDAVDAHHASLGICCQVAMQLKHS